MDRLFHEVGQMAIFHDEGGDTFLALFMKIFVALNLPNNIVNFLFYRSNICRIITGKVGEFLT